ncbi:MAG TPA: hypothetical protein DF383_06400 [Deltaproteobacteria bacterium]|nr:hypothetical protein [Deltaproteobacteria bacterium]
METAKEEVQKILSHLPDNCSLEDIQYHLYVLQKIQKGLEEVRQGRLLTQDAVVCGLKKRLEK